MVTTHTIKFRLKKPSDSQHVKRFQTLVKSSWEHFYHIFSSLWGEIIWEISPWLTFEIVGKFVNIWSADYKYPIPDCENLRCLFKSNYLKNKKHFLGFLFHLWNLYQILNILKKKKILIANVFPKLGTV